MIGATLRRVRAQLGLSQARLAERLGVAENTYQAYETTARTPANEVLDRLWEIVESEVRDGELVAAVGEKVARIRTERRKLAPYGAPPTGAQTTTSASAARERRREAARQRRRQLRSESEQQLRRGLREKGNPT